MWSTEPTLRVVGTRTLPPRLNIRSTKSRLARPRYRQPSTWPPSISTKRRALTASAKRMRSRIANAAPGPSAPAKRVRDRTGSDPSAGSGGSTCGAGGSVLGLVVGRSERQMPLVAIGARLCAICLALPEAHEERMTRGPSYRVHDKIFAVERPWNDWLALWCKVPEGTRDIILGASPSRFFDSPLWRQGLDRRRSGPSGRLDRGRGFRPSQLPAHCAEAARQAHWRKPVSQRSAERAGRSKENPSQG